MCVFCDSSHCCSNAATAFSEPPPAFLSCAHAALPTDSKLIKNHIQALFIEISLCVDLFETVGCGHRDLRAGNCRLLSGACQKKVRPNHSSYTAAMMDGSSHNLISARQRGYSKHSWR